jgi:hypothetical protein
LPKLPNHRLWTRGVMVVGAAVVLYFTANQGREVAFARQVEKLDHKSQNVHCSEDYTAELKNFEGCIPQQCGRLVTDNLVESKEATELLQVKYLMTKCMLKFIIVKT